MNAFVPGPARLRHRRASSSCDTRALRHAGVGPNAVIAFDHVDRGGLERILPGSKKGDLHLLGVGSAEVKSDPIVGLNARKLYTREIVGGWVRRNGGAEAARRGAGTISSLAAALESLEAFLVWAKQVPPTKMAMHIAKNSARFISCNSAVSLPDPFRETRTVTHCRACGGCGA